MEEPATAGLDLQHPCSAPSPEPSSPHMLEPGQVLLNRFEIVEFIGSGGLGEVYRAREYEQKAGLALKTARMALAAEQSAMASLRNEVNMARLVTMLSVLRRWYAALGFARYDTSYSDSQPFRTTILPTSPISVRSRSKPS